MQQLFPFADGVDRSSDTKPPVSSGAGLPLAQSAWEICEVIDNGG